MLTCVSLIAGSIRRIGKLASCNLYKRGIESRLQVLLFVIFNILNNPLTYLSNIFIKNQGPVG